MNTTSGILESLVYVSVLNELQSILMLLTLNVAVSKCFDCSGFNLILPILETRNPKIQIKVVYIFKLYLYLINIL